MVVICPTSQGAMAYQRAWMGPACPGFDLDFNALSGAPLTVDGRQVVAQTSASAGNTLPTLAGAHGELWALDGQGTAFPLVLDAPPAATSFGAQQDALLSFADWHYLLVPGVGSAVDLVDVPASVAGYTFPTAGTGPSPYAGSVDGEPDWKIYPDRVAQLLDARESLVARLQLPVSLGAHGAIVGGRGGHELLVTSGDAVYSGPIDARLDGGAPASLAVRGVPMYGATVLAVAALPPSPDGGADFSGCALTQNGLFAFTARTGTDWTIAPVALPAGEWITTRTDGDRARVGYSDGTVLSLPNAIVLSEPLPGGASDFRRACGQTFAGGPNGIFTLQRNPDGGARGIWNAASGFSTARLLAHDHALEAFSAWGEQTRLTVPACP